MGILQWLAGGGLPLPDANFGTPDWAINLTNPGTVLTDEEELVQAVEIIAGTPLGTDPLRPEFGTPVADYIDAPINRTGPALISAITNAVRSYEKRVTVLSVTPELSEEGRKQITIIFQRAGQLSSRPLTATFALQ